MKIVQAPQEDATVAIREMGLGRPFRRHDGSVWMRAYGYSDLETIDRTVCCDLHDGELRGFQREERVTPLDGAFHDYGPKEVT